MAEILHTRMGVITYLAPTGCIAEAEGLESLQETVASCVASREIKLVLDLDRVPALTSLALEALLDIQDRLARLGGSLKGEPERPGGGYLSGYRFARLH